MFKWHTCKKFSH